MAELGVALLLFSIGLEFSFRRLRRMGARAFMVGVLQILMTLGVFAAAFAGRGPPYLRPWPWGLLLPVPI